MSIISNVKKQKKAARHNYMRVLAEIRTAEHNAMNEMLDILRSADGMMTAAQLEAACTSGISKHEIAGNLHAMETGCSRYDSDSFPYDKRIPRVNVPRFQFKKGERIVSEERRRKATFVEIDENGGILLGHYRTITIRESKGYAIEKK